LKNLKLCLNKIFSETQIFSIFKNKSNKKKQIKWTPEDISKCIVLRALSSKAYDFWKDKIGMPLPSASTLKIWCGKFTCSPGILKDVLLLMEKNCETLDDREKLCVLSFNEMHIDKKI